MNHRHELFGHVFSGRYKALSVEGGGNGYLRTVCDYVHLNPVRAGLVGSRDRLLAYPWSSLLWYMAAPEHRPGWMRVDRLLGEHGIQKDTAEGRAAFEERMEGRRRERSDESEWKPVERGWCLGSEAFRAKLLERMEPHLGEHHSGRLRQESAQAKAERIIAESLKGLKWKEAELKGRPKGDRAKVELAWRLRRETTLTIRQIAERLSMGSWKSLNNKLYLLGKERNATAK
jgi:hypothetical protein